MSRVAATPTPMSARENHPVIAEKVLSSTQRPNTSDPSPCSVIGRVTMVTTIAHTVPTPDHAVFSRIRLRNGRSSAATGILAHPAIMTAWRPATCHPARRERGR